MLVTGVILSEKSAHILDVSAQLDFTGPYCLVSNWAWPDLARVKLGQRESVFDGP